jgi:plasmid stabilization system protein ParE
MTRPLIVRPEAEADVRAIHRYLEELQSGLGDRFAGKLREAFERIESMPESCSHVWQDVRALRVRKFQYVLYYVAFSDRVEVLAILHGARHESAWQIRRT